MSPKILVADDEPNIVISLEYLLKREGYNVVIARDGQEALDAILREEPDLVLLDVMMPKKTGFEVCQEVRSNEALQATKILMLTAKGRDTDVAKGLALGADVPFFLGGQHAWVEGIGEILTPIPLAKADFLIVKPDAGLDTRMIFSDPSLKRDSEPAIISGFAANAFGNTGSNPGFGRNDLQAVAQKLCPGVTQALAWLASQGLSGRMTGSGSAVFAHLPQGVVWDAASVPNAFQVRQCSSLDVHPLHGWATSDS